MSKNDLKFNGKITNILEVVEVGADKKIEFVVTETNGQYPQSVKFGIFGTEKVDKFLQYNKVDQEVEVLFNFKTNEWQGKYFTNNEAWRVNKVQSEETPF
jgi:single-strand DNA-binding protein